MPCFPQQGQGEEQRKSSMEGAEGGRRLLSTAVVARPRP